MTHSDSNQSIFQRHRRKILVILAVTPMLLLDCAVGLLFLPADHNSFREPSPFYHHGFMRNRSVVARWGAGDEYPLFTNSLGLLDSRIREVPLRSDTHRIVFMGDSYTEGIGVGWEHTFVGQLAERIGPSRAEVLNAAVLSYCPLLYFLKTRWLLEEIGVHFDELYVFIDISDVQDEVLYSDFRPRLPGSQRSLATAMDHFLRRRSYTYATTQHLLRKWRTDARRKRYHASYYPPWLDYFWLDNINERAFGDPDFPRIRDSWTLDPAMLEGRWVKQGLRLARNHMTELVELCARHGIKLTIGVYPWTTQIRGGDRDSIQTRVWRDFATLHGIDFIDLFPALFTGLPPDEFEDRYVLRGDVHWNQMGHALVADAIWPYVENSLGTAEGK